MRWYGGLALVSLVFLSVFRQTVGRIWKFVSLKPSAPQGKSSLKNSAHQEKLEDLQTNKLTHTYTHICESVCMYTYSHIRKCNNTAEWLGKVQDYSFYH